MISRVQLLDLGYSDAAIKHRIAEGRLHAIWPGVYCVGWPEPTRLGLFAGAVLCAGPGAALSHDSAAALWGIRRDKRRAIHVTVPGPGRPRREGIVVHRRPGIAHERIPKRDDIPVTDPLSTLTDLAARLPRDPLEAAVNEADKLDLLDLEHARASLDRMPNRPGARRLRATIDEHTFRFTDSALERAFLRLVARAGLELPRTREKVHSYRVDFHWPELRLVVETDGGRFHRTPLQQTRDRERDHAHYLAGLTPLRFTHGQIKYAPGHVVTVLSEACRRALVLAETG